MTESEGYKLLESAKLMKRQIGVFVKTHKVTVPLPRGKNREWLEVRTDKSSHLNEDERDRITNYLCMNFKELRNLGNPEVASLIHDTIEYIITHRRKQRGKVMIIITHFIHYPVAA